MYALFGCGPPSWTARPSDRPRKHQRNYYGVVATEKTLQRQRQRMPSPANMLYLGGEERFSVTFAYPGMPNATCLCSASGGGGGRTLVATEVWRAPPVTTGLPG